MPRSQPADRGVAYFAAFLDLLHKKVVVVGGGRVASTKVRSLLPCQPEPLRASSRPRTSTGNPAGPHARPAHLAPSVAYALRQTSRGCQPRLRRERRRQLNARVAADARRLGIPVLAVDDVPNCDFIAPAIVRRGEVTVAVRLPAADPAMARRTRELLEAALPPYWGDLLGVAADARERLGGTRG